MSFVLSFFPRGVLDEILNLIESVSEGFPSYSSIRIFSANFFSSILKFFSLKIRSYKNLFCLVWKESKDSK